MFFPIKENDAADLITVICIVSLLSFHLPCLYQARPVSKGRSLLVQYLNFYIVILTLDVPHLK